MKLMVQSYNYAYNAEEEETAFLHYEPTHGFDAPAEVRITLSDPTGLIAQKYINASISAMGGAVADDGGAETDETTEANEDTADDMTLLPTNPVTDDAYYFGFASTFRSVTINISTAGVGTWGFVYEYSKGADSWTALSGVTDNTTQFKTAGNNSITWTIPSDWATDEVGGIASLYWVRVRLVLIAHTSSPKGEQAWIGGIYVGPGKVTIEDPDATDIFYGRIMKAEATAEGSSKTFTLYCQDWLSQLDEEQITYDMREDLDGSGLRQSQVMSDTDNGTAAHRAPAYTTGATYYVWDDDMSGTWSNDEWNGKYLIFSNEIAGSQSISTGPHSISVSRALDTNPLVTDGEYCWVDDGNKLTAADDGILFHIYSMHKTRATEGSLYVAASLSAMRVRITYSQVDGFTDSYIYVRDVGEATLYEIGRLLNESSEKIRKTTFEVPLSLAASILEADGSVDIAFRIETAEDTTCTFKIYYLKFEMDFETTGYSTAIAISDTVGDPARLTVNTDLDVNGLGIWDHAQYCIAKEIYLHIESATGPVLGGDSMVTLTCGAANVENTAGISTRQYVDKTRLEIWQDLAVQDKAHFWLALGTVIVTYKSTFNDGSPETLTDTDVNSLRSTFDYSTLVNKVTAYGMRIGDQRLSSTYTDSTSEGKYNQTRTKVTNDTGLVSEYDTLARATALVNQYKNVQQILTATIRGNTAKALHDKTLVLGDEVSITSSYLGLTAAVYIVQRWSYSSRNNLTTLLLHPRVSAIGLQKDERPSFEMVMQANRRGTADRYIAAPETHEVA